jgi:hypothetical protein
MSVLHVPTFGGGVVLAGSSDAQASNEIIQGDNVDIGSRGQLVTTGGISPYGMQLNDGQGTPQPVTQVYGLGPASFAQNVQAFAVSGGLNGSAVAQYYCHVFSPGFTANGMAATLGSVGTTRSINGAVVTFAPFPYVDTAGVQRRPLFFNVGARSMDQPRTAPGLYVASFSLGGGGLYTQSPISTYCALGTGTSANVTGQPGDSGVVGTHGQQLFFRGICAYNNALFGFGFNNGDATNGDGPSHLMFSNIGNPYFWGNDNLAAVGTNRLFSDTDGIDVGAAGEVITALCSSHGKLYIATNRGLHYLSGYGRDSWQTDGTTGIAQSLDVIGPNAMIEGPDGLLYGVSSRGLWRLNTLSYFTVPVEHLYRKLVKFDGTSPGYWDLISTNPTASPGYPGTTNSDLVWMYSDVTNMQVGIVIPFTNFDGSGNGTVIIKYHTESGGFTRQVISPNNISFTAGASFRRSPTSAAVTVFGDSGSGNGLTVRQYPPLNPANTATTGNITFGEYAPFGPDGEGVCRICYLVLSWVSDALPITGTITPSVDQRVFPTVNLTISPTQPGSPLDGDLWVDTSGMDPNLGNATSGTIVVALNDYLVKLWKASWSQWVILPRSGGAKGSRNGIPIAFTAQRGTRVKIALTLSAADKVQVEGLGLEPSVVRQAA